LKQEDIQTVLSCTYCAIHLLSPEIECLLYYFLNCIFLNWFAFILKQTAQKKSSLQPYLSAFLYKCAWIKNASSFSFFKFLFNSCQYNCNCNCFKLDRAILIFLEKIYFNVFLFLKIDDVLNNVKNEFTSLPNWKFHAQVLLREKIRSLLRKRRSNSQMIPAAKIYS